MRSLPSLVSRSALALAIALACVAPARAATWEVTSLPAGSSYTLAVAPDGRIVAFGGGDVHVSTDDGATWQALGPFVPFGFARQLAFAPTGELFAADFALGVFRSDDGGATWTAPLAEEGCNGLAVSAGGVVFAGLTYTGIGFVHHSTDLGASWTGAGLPGGSNSFAVECFAFGAGGEVYAGTIDGPYRSDDLGLSWQPVRAGIAGTHVRTMAMTPGQHLFAQTLFPGNFDGLYRSTDRGATWQSLGNSAPYFASLIATAGGHLYGASDTAVYRSVDDGVTWTPLADGLAAFEELASVVVTPSGRLLTGGGRVYRSTLALVDVPPARAVLDGVRLAPAHPHPVRERASVTFTLPRAARVRLALFDVGGRRVATLADGERGAGEHRVTLDATQLAAGVYVARLEADGRTRTQRLVVTR